MMQPPQGNSCDISKSSIHNHSKRVTIEMPPELIRHVTPLCYIDKLKGEIHRGILGLI